MARSNLGVYWDWQSVGRHLEPSVESISFNDGNISVSTGFDGEIGDIDLTYSSALNLASKLLQWATNLPESEKGNVHRVDGEWVDVDRK